MSQFILHGIPSSVSEVLGYPLIDGLLRNQFHSVVIIGGSPLFHYLADVKASLSLIFFSIVSPVILQYFPIEAVDLLSF